MAKPNDYITATRKNFVSNDNEGRMVEKCIVEIQGTFLVKIRDDALNRNVRENAFKHIDKFPKVVGPVKINRLTQDRFRLSVFPVSLAGATSEWFIKECIGLLTTWDNMVEKFVMKFRYLSDHDEEEETEEDDNPNEMDNLNNDIAGAIMGYGDYVIGDSVISRNIHVLFRDTDGVELIKGSRGSNLYTILVEDMMKSSSICLLSKASKNKSWLWHRRLNHLNFSTINNLARKDLVRGLPRLKFKKDHLFSACQLGKSKKYTHIPKTENTNLKVLNTLHMDLFGPMRVQTINGKKYILVIIDDYSSIFHQKSVPRTPQQNGVVERRNCTLVEAARTMLIFSKAPMFLWAEAIATACYTKNRSLIHTRHNKTPYELVHDKKPGLTFLRVFGALCYPTNDIKDLGKLQPTADIGIFVGYAPSRKAPVQLSTGPAPTFLTTGQISSGLVPNLVPVAPYVPINKELEILFQPMFDEYLEPPHVERLVSSTPAVQVPNILADTPSSTTIDQGAPSLSHSPSSSELQPPISHQGVVARSTLIEDNLFANADNDPFVNVFAPEPSSEASSSEDVSLVETTYVTQPHHHVGK
ncbi:retrovirus-related pol polyprotein from transposon TNT 1-94 [Tanacetum coccineum]|uniref:Retrovirus-related pol polyprotein from transposon TNT 1-94 n=1 Tax=Tanacetum coccineum TaxID=301880 RepID=A0ABQ5HCI1_9ASTR